MRVGITGHQQLEDPEAWPWVEEIVGRELDAAAAPVVVVTSLAVGADQLVARLGIARGATVHAVLPFAGIERTFAAEDLQAYRRLVSQATVEVLQTPGTDEDAYMAAGRRVVELSDVMIAVWDAKPAKGKAGPPTSSHTPLRPACLSSISTRLSGQSPDFSPLNRNPLHPVRTSALKSRFAPLGFSPIKAGGGAALESTGGGRAREPRAHGEPEGGGDATPASTYRSIAASSAECVPTTTASASASIPIARRSGASSAARATAASSWMSTGRWTPSVPVTPAPLACLATATGERAMAIQPHPNRGGDVRAPPYTASSRSRSGRIAPARPTISSAVPSHATTARPGARSASVAIVRAARVGSGPGRQPRTPTRSRRATSNAVGCRHDGVGQIRRVRCNRSKRTGLIVFTARWGRRPRARRRIQIACAPSASAASAAPTASDDERKGAPDVPISTMSGFNVPPRWPRASAG